MIVTTDCSVISPQPSHEEAAWYQRLYNISPSDLVISLGNRQEEAEPIVYCQPNGQWWTGRYIGTLKFDGLDMEIKPRLGLPVIERWLQNIFNIHLLPSSGQLRNDVSFIVQLLAIVWRSTLQDAARHGLPALLAEKQYVGDHIKGRLDISASIPTLPSKKVVSGLRERSVDNPISRSIVAAYDVLRRWLPGLDPLWLPMSSRNLITHLQSAVGMRPRVPTRQELSKVRYTPITLGYKRLVDLSLRIIEGRGVHVDLSRDGQCQGILLDVAELWELYVVCVLKRAMPELSVLHGTRDPMAEAYLLKSLNSGRVMGLMKPDVVLREGVQLKGIIDAKYKRLGQSPQREDLYQMAAYLTQYDALDGWGALVYPEELDVEGVSDYESQSPWRLTQKQSLSFITLPSDIDVATKKLRQVVMA